MISIIIPTKNRKELLAKTLDNIYKQSQQPHEVIVVDDGSTDGTKEYIKSQYGDRVIILTNKKQGPGSARNAGLRQASGKFIKFFDSDDLMTLNCLEDQFSKLSNTSADAIYCPYVKATEVEENQWIANDVIMQFHRYSNHNNLSYYMIRGLFLIVPSFLFRKELLDEVGPWNEECVAYEDWEYLWRISRKANHILHTNSSAIIYRMHGQQTMGSNFNDAQRDHDKSIALLPILKEVVRSKEYSIFDKLFILNDNNKSIIYGDDLLKDAPFFLQNQLVLKSSSMIIRSIRKYNRWLTGSNWQKMHGTNTSREAFRNYILSASLNSPK